MTALPNGKKKNGANGATRARRRTAKRKVVIMTEKDHELHFRLTISGFGKTDVVLRSVLIRLCAALHHTFGVGRWKLQYLEPTTDGGPWKHHPVTYDSKAHDGEHVDHAITIKLDDDVIEGAIS